MPPPVPPRKESRNFNGAQEETAATTGAKDTNAVPVPPEGSIGPVPSHRSFGGFRLHEHVHSRLLSWDVK